MDNLLRDHPALAEKSGKSGAKTRTFINEDGHHFSLGNYHGKKHTDPGNGVTIVKGTNPGKAVIHLVPLKIDYLEEEKPASTDAKEKPANIKQENANANAKLKRENITDVNIKEKHVVVNYHNYQLCFYYKNIIDYKTTILKN